jgi:hypothetical protein
MNPEQSKLLCKVFLDTIQQEAETTKKVPSIYGGSADEPMNV